MILARVSTSFILVMTIFLSTGFGDQQSSDVRETELLLLQNLLASHQARLGILQLQAHGLAHLAGPVDLPIGTVFDITGIALLLRPRPFGLFTTVSQLLLDVTELRTDLIALFLHYIALRT